MLGAGRAAEHALLFEQQDIETATGEDQRRDEAIVASSDDDDVRAVRQRALFDQKPQYVAMRCGASQRCALRLPIVFASR